MTHPHFEHRRGLFADLALDGLRQGPPERDVSHEVVAQFLAGAFLAVRMWWVREGRDTSPEEADALYTRLATTGLVGVAERAQGE